LHADFSGELSLIREITTGKENSASLTGGTRRSFDAAIRIYIEAGNVIETHEHGGGFDRTLKNLG
jgi:hypothetical protein